MNMLKLLINLCFRMEKYQDISLSSLLFNENLRKSIEEMRKSFEKMMENEFCDNNLNFLIEVIQFTKMEQFDLIDKYKQIIEKYIFQDSEDAINISSKIRDGLIEKYNEKLIDRFIFNDAYQEIYTSIYLDNFNRYIETKINTEKEKNKTKNKIFPSSIQITKKFSLDNILNFNKKTIKSDSPESTKVHKTLEKKKSFADLFFN